MPLPASPASGATLQPARRSASRNNKENRMKWLLILLLVFAVAASAADVTGNWKATAEGPNGPMERTFTFKVDGTRLTGETTSSMFGKSIIADGKVEGDNLSFTITVKFQDNEMKLLYKGKVNGNEIRFTVEMQDGGNTLEWLAKRVS
jgi:hypothetical protein